MSEIYECPICGGEVEIEMWRDGQCPECGNEYWWTQEYREDDDGYEDSWESLEWESYEPEDDEMYEDDEGED
jgi:predicted RNA-binding Zn-ribbon protein involved in translation (DUF1610 family)